MGFSSAFAAFCLAAAACVLAAAAASLRLRQRAFDRDAALSDRALFEQGAKADGGGQRVEEGPLGRLLKDAGIEASASSWALCLAAIAVVVAMLAWKAGGAMMAAVGVGLVALAAAGYVDRARSRRKALFSRQFIRVLPQLSASVKSSMTFDRSLRVCAQHAPEPLRSELLTAIARASYGTPLVQAMERMARDTGDADVAALAAAMRIQHRFGGSMAAVLDMVADHANSRASMMQELRGELAGTRMATWVVAAAMPAIFLLMYVTNPSFARFYTGNAIGWAVLAGAAFMEVAGIVACRRVTRFKI